MALHWEGTALLAQACFRTKKLNSFMPWHSIICHLLTYIACGPWAFLVNRDWHENSLQEYLFDFTWIQELTNFLSFICNEVTKKDSDEMFIRFLASDEPIQISKYICLCIGPGVLDVEMACAWEGLCWTSAICRHWLQFCVQLHNKSLKNQLP